VLDKSNGKLEPDILKELYFNLGTIYHYNKNYVNALRCYELGLRYDPTNPELLRRIPGVKLLKETEPAK
jgi:tetratricopeptide (TPR) repeat protein